MVDFGGWDMPLHYGSQIKEHHQVRSHSGMFDVSHMTVVDIEGQDAFDYLRKLLANDVSKLVRAGTAIYSVMLNEQGGVIDDLIAYFRGAGRYRLVVNCATREKDLAWMNTQASGLAVSVNERPALAILAAQGPEAQEIVRKARPEKDIGEVSYFEFVERDDWMIAATGYTGEEGFEIILPEAEAVELWRNLADKGVQPIGLGARDSLRLEAGYCLYGHEMDEAVNPLSAGLGWTISLEDDTRKFIGREAVAQAKADTSRAKLVGLVLEDKGVLRAGQTVLGEDGSEGIITSGGFSPTLEKSIALARVPMSVSDQCQVLMRDKKKRAKIVKPSFVRHGKILV